MSEGSESQVVKVDLPVSGRFSELSRGEDLSNIVVANKLLSSDGDLALKTRINNPSDLVLIELLAVDARADGMNDLGDLYDTIIKSFRENSCSVGGWRSEQMAKILIADANRNGGDGDDDSFRERAISKRRER